MQPQHICICVVPVKFLLLIFLIFFNSLCCNVSSVRAESDLLVFSTNECSLTEPIYGHKFDFGALHSQLAHHAISDKGDVFDFNICGNLKRKCDGQFGVAACMRKNGKEFVLGRQHELHYRRGKMYFNYTQGAACPNGTGVFQLHIFVDCDYTLDQTQFHVTAYADDTCSYYITYETPLACLPTPIAAHSNSCTVRDKVTGHIYDLLSLSDVNYRTTDRQGSVFVINVCKPVLYSENAMCPPGSSVCQFNQKENDYKKRFVDYGSVQANPIIENGRLLMRHASPTPCNATTNYTSIINFNCDKDIKNAHPEFVGLKACVYNFNFMTSLACNVPKPCTAITHGNEILNLTSLAAQAAFKLNKDNKTYIFAVCARAGEPCLEQNGACVTENKQKMSLGNVNSNLRFNQTGSLYLLYENGAECNTTNGNTYWSTKIEFICANNATKDNVTIGGAVPIARMKLQPKIIEDSNCQLLIQYQTQLACQEQIQCKAKTFMAHTDDGSGMAMVDLTPLISASENYEAKIDLPIEQAQKVSKTTKFYLNVCRPLVPKYQLGCAGGSGACMAKISTSGSPEEEHSLGFPMVSLVAINHTAAELLYNGGDPCPSNITTRLSARIGFYCDMRAGHGTPVLRSIDNCQYNFVWHTAVICPAHDCSYRQDTCEIIQDDLDLHYNLREASFTNAGHVKINSTTVFDLNICSAYLKAQTDYSQDLVNLFFTEDGPCVVDGKINVHMRLICSSDTYSVTSFIDDTMCNLLYEQRTPDICSFLGLSMSTETTPKPTIMPLTTAKPSDGQITTPANDNKSNNTLTATGSVAAILAAILSLTCVVTCVGLFTFSPERRRSVRHLFRRSTSAVRYSRVQSNEEANLLLEPNGQFTESDDDMLL